MKDPLRQERFEAPKPRGNARMNVAERRSATRQHFIAEAQIVELKSGAKLAARSCDLVVHGCYVDTINPFPVGTRVRIRLKKDETTVEAGGQVVYGIPGLGMGIAFHNLTPSNRVALEKWLESVTIGDEIFDVMIPPISIEEPVVLIEQPPSGQVADLIQLLMKKGILNSDEAAGLLKESLGR